MFALLIKPAAMKKSSHRKVISALKEAGATQLQGHNVGALRQELNELLHHDPNLVLVACGGDGTVNLAVNTVADMNVPLAVLPMGTGNDFARHIGLRDLGQAVAALSDLNFEQVDLGLIQLKDGKEEYFAAVASCGFDAQVNERANLLNGPNGPAKYLWSVFGELRALNSIWLNLSFNSKTSSGKYSLIAIGNTSSYGGGMRITPAADIQDGLFTCTIVRSVTRRTLVRVLPKVFSGRHVFHPAVEVDQTETIEITGSDYPIYADGERIGLGPAIFTVLPARLRLVMPNNI